MNTTQGRSILVVDDDPISQVVLVQNLLKYNPLFEIDLAASAAEALAFARSQTYSFVFLDIRLPDMSGFEVLRQLQQMDPPSPQVIAHSAIAGHDEHQRFIDAGFTDYLPKPVTIAKLRQLIVAISTP